MGSLRAANVIRIVDDDIIWTGGDTVVVQLGDVLDRGDHEIGEHGTGMLLSWLRHRMVMLSRL